MAYAVGAALLVLVAIAVLYGVVTGRRQRSGCCAPADPRHDLRMRSAFEPEDS